MKEPLSSTHNSSHNSQTPNSPQTPNIDPNFPIHVGRHNSTFSIVSNSTDSAPVHPSVVVTQQSQESSQSPLTPLPSIGSLMLPPPSSFPKSGVAVEALPSPVASPFLPSHATITRSNNDIPSPHTTQRPFHQKEHHRHHHQPPPPPMYQQYHPAQPVASQSMHHHQSPMSMSYYCPNIPHGCTWSGYTQDELTEHLQVHCMKRTVYCINRQFGCVWAGPIEQLQDHAHERLGCLIFTSQALRQQLAQVQEQHWLSTHADLKNPYHMGPGPPQTREDSAKSDSEGRNRDVDMTSRKKPRHTKERNKASQPVLNTSGQQFMTINCEVCRRVRATCRPNPLSFFFIQNIFVFYFNAQHHRKCSKNFPSCAECNKRGIECTYPIPKKRGRPLKLGGSRKETKATKKESDCI